VISQVVIISKARVPCLVPLLLYVKVGHAKVGLRYYWYRYVCFLTLNCGYRVGTSTGVDFRVELEPFTAHVPWR